MSAATEALDAMIATCNALENLIGEAMPALTKAVRTNIERTITAGTSSYGEPWKPTKQGQQPLRHAANALSVIYVSGVRERQIRTIYVILKGPEARHHKGRVKGGLKRGIIPERGLPKAMANDLRKVLYQAFNEAVQQ